MSRPDNYAIMAEQARKLFLTYDQDAIIAKSPVTFDDESIFLPVLDQTCRIDRRTGLIYWSSEGGWLPGGGFAETLTIFDYLCDAKPHRRLSGQLRSMASFGHMFHTGLLENKEATVLERFIDEHPDAFAEGCRKLGGVPFFNCDLGFTLPFFPDLPVTLQFWHSDEDFPASLRFLWDSSTTDYIRYETMYYALDILRSRLAELMPDCKIL